jgi:prepilin-type N-terminal cleavage/methylation domain-containing protein
VVKKVNEELSLTCPVEKENLQHGFTIVELLIVIVVIAILAAISVVAYTGIQERANASVIQNDLANVAKKIHLLRAETGEYPVGGASIATDGASAVGVHAASPEPSLDFKVTRSAYREPTSSGSVNFTYCTGPGVDSGQPEFIVTGQTKSLKIYQYSSMNGAESIASTSLTYPNVVCRGIDFPRSLSYGYSYNAGGWQSWTE